MKRLTDGMALFLGIDIAIAVKHAEIHLVVNYLFYLPLNLFTY